jgi:O-acetyl-ADP-ribose deacetylase (regulator of RNase III)
MKSLTYKTGNLLTASDVHVIGHQANTQNTFGAGIALSIRKMYPAAYEADTKASLQQLNQLGAFSYARVVDSLERSPKWVFNLYGQYSYGSGRRTNYESLYTALLRMRNNLEINREFEMSLYDSETRIHLNPVPTVGFPYQMGCYRAGGSWDIVSRLIEEAFDGYKSDVIIYALKAN